jgi:hypothetical protein
MAEPSADAELGDGAYGEEPRSVTYEADEDITAGDVVAITSGLVHQADDTTDTQDIGVAARDAADGDQLKVYIEGPVVTNVASGVSAGAELTLSGTDGQLAAGAGDYQALTDEGAVAGLSAGYGLAANSAVVNF